MLRYPGIRNDHIFQDYTYGIEPNLPIRLACWCASNYVLSGGPLFGIVIWQVISLFIRSVLPLYKKLLFLRHNYYTGSVTLFSVYRYGRKLTLTFAGVLEVFSGIMVTFLPNFWSFTILRTVVGISVGDVMVLRFVVVIEYVGNVYRNVISILFHIPFTLGNNLIYWIFNWRLYTFAFDS